MQSLPIEIVTAALEYLPQRDLRKAASVSRTFYRAAQHAGLCIHKTMLLEYLPSLDTFNAVVDHAIRKQDCPGISLKFVCDYDRFLRHDWSALMDRVFGLVQKALPVLVKLRVYVPGLFSAALYEALRSPAPRLRSLALGQIENRRTLRTCNSTPLPEDLFQGLPGCLREVLLVLPSLEPDWPAIPAFRCVRRANIFLSRPASSIAIGRFFPSVRALLLDVGLGISGDPPLSTPEMVDLTGLALRHLAISQLLVPVVLSDVPLRDLRIVEHLIGKTVRWDETLWPQDADRSDLDAHFSRGRRGILAEFRPRGGEWTRLLRTPHLAWNEPLAALSSISQLQPRLVTVILDTEFVLSFFRCSASLDALREIYIDITAASYESEREMCDCDVVPREQIVLRCPAVAAVTIFSLSCIVRVRAERVAAIGLALRMHERPEEERAVVRLMRTCFVEPATRNRVRRVFSQVIEGHPLDSAFRTRYLSCLGEASSLNVSTSDPYISSDTLHY